MKKQLPLSLFVSLIGISLVIIGTLVAFLLLGQRQDPRQQAAVPGGQVEVALSPATKSLQKGESATLTISLDTKRTAIAGLAVRVTYPLVTSNPTLLTASNPTPLLAQNDSNWSCSVVMSEVKVDRVNIDLGCLYLGKSGYSTETAKPIASFTLTAGTAQTTTPVTLTFDSENTVATPLGGNTDIAALPTATSVITVQAQETSPDPTKTPTPTATPSPTPPPSPTPLAGLASCNQTCLANRDCQGELICFEGRCRANRCSQDTSCQCRDLDVANQTNTQTLPNSGAVTTTYWLLALGGLFILAALSLVISRLEAPPE